MNKNLIYIVAVPDSSAKVNVFDYAKYSVTSWDRYCNKYDIDLLVVDENLDERFAKPIWNKEMICAVGQQYDKIGIVDCDTMIHPDAPNIFDMYSDDEFCGVNDLCDLNWLLESISQRQWMFPDVKMNIFKYLNAGVLFFSNKHLHLFKKVLNLYFENKDWIDNWKGGGGKEQTILNFVIQENDINVRLLEPSWNLLSIHRKNMFTHNWQLNLDHTPYFIKYAHVWHFTGFPIEDRVRLMQQTWDLIK